MRADLLRRLRRLEEHLLQPPPGTVTLVYRCGEPDREPGPGERIVKDWCGCCGRMPFTRGRITSDPHDRGMLCGDPEVLADLLPDRSNLLRDIQPCWQVES